jgi:hypothetical protein
LIQGMPVALTEHIDRSPDKRLLRGKIGFIHSWEVHKREKREFEDGVRVLQKIPRTVFVQYLNADGTEPEWKIPGLSRRGLYPIAPKKATWYLDKGRRYPVLGIRRHQLPLAPAYAMTAHCSHGADVEGWRCSRFAHRAGHKLHSQLRRHDASREATRHAHL